MKRSEMFEQLKETYDVLVVGGGATGVGIALDAVSRGYRTALIEGGDFAQATSSRATKLVHGGVRYLASGQIHLVYEALHERAVMRRSAPHLVHPLPFITPTYHLGELPYYGAGLLIYDVMSGKSTMGPTRILGKNSVMKRLPGIAREGLKGGVMYHDGQFNDARLAMIIALTAADHGATVLNYARCVRFLYEGDKVHGAVVRDEESKSEFEVHAKVVINATGIFVDELRKMDEASAANLLSVSRGTHIVVGAHVLGGDHAIMVPKTEDGRVIFAIPWQGRVVIGTTDIAAHDSVMEPGHTQDEIDYIIATINPYLETKLERKDILSVFSGLRPLVTGPGASTSKLSREHHIDASKSGLITVTGGKWTTYRRMAQDTLDFAIEKQMLPNLPCVTKDLKLHGTTDTLNIADPYLREYGSDAVAIQKMIVENPALGKTIDAELPYTFAEILFAVRYEMARTLEDALSRRTRSILLNSKAALRAAPAVVDLIASELKRDELWQQEQLAAFAALVKADYSI